MGRRENGGKGPTEPEAETLARNKDQGVTRHEQRQERKEGKETEGSQERESLEEKVC